MKKIIGVILGILLVFLVVSPSLVLANDVKPLAPDFELVSVDGSELKLSDFKGKLILLHFWAPWCGPCKEEMPSLEELYQEYKEKGLEVVAVAIGTWWVERKDWNVNFTLLVDPGREAAKKYFVSFIPVTVLISPKGKIIRKFFGAQNWKNPELIKIIEKNLPEENLGKNNEDLPALL